MGMLIARYQDLVNNGEDLVIMDNANSSILNFALSEETSRVSEDDPAITQVRAGIYKMYDHNLNVDLAARVYLVVKYASGNEYEYTAFDPATDLRSASGVATKYKADYLEDCEFNAEIPDTDVITMLDSYIVA